MTQTEMYCMTQERNVLADRLSGFLKTRFAGPCRDQELARIIDAHPRTARNYFNGYWPGARQWRAIVRQFGKDVLAAVFDPEIDEVNAQLAAEIRDMEAALETKRAALRALAGGQARMAEVEDR